MAAAKCDASFKIEYESSSPITEATVTYLNPPGPTHDIKQLLTINNTIKLNDIQNDIQAPDTYDLEVKLAVDDVVTTKRFSLNVGRCTSSSCYVPKIYEIKVLDDGQIVMNYWVDTTTNLAALEYQIAKDPGFKDEDIIYSKVGFSDVNYTQFENIDMRNGNIPDKTRLYIRIRKYCGRDGVSDWSDFVEFDSGIWGVEAYCLSGVDDRNKDALCYGTDPAWKMKVTLQPFRPDVGSLICLTNGKPAIPENIRDFEQNAPENLKKSGIRWIRFLRSNSDFNPSLIYRVKPETGEIEVLEGDVKCY
ncbi:hypothetical protein KYG33_07090 [Chryseobacterium sp. D764]|jgi:hypothetical protein|uniref:hypothetical protein n=1 Tax=unclassified Chryseobacterium TaxID=2593645 RepID=UPI000984B40F|nr:MULTISPECIES: hypothetical protein [unclassified Chryseobacterium]QXU50796.1 hypothetical protein KYG33_07090 [Chryseobacterium sp. D764]CAD0219825.1 conserved protein of unknown function [Chryseobacterium sp. JV274]